MFITSRTIFCCSWDALVWPDKTAGGFLGFSNYSRVTTLTCLSTKHTKIVLSYLCPWHPVQQHSWFTTLEMQFCLEEFCFYGSQGGLSDSWHKGPGCLVSCCTKCNKCCNESMAAELGRQIQLGTLVLVFLGIPKSGSSAERFVVTWVQKGFIQRWDSSHLFTHTYWSPIDLFTYWSPTASLLGLWKLQHTAGNISSTAALSWILAVFSSVTNGRMTSLPPRAENIWVRQHHSPQNRGGCCEEKGDFELPHLHCVMSLLFDCLMIITGFKVNLGSPEETKKKSCIYGYKFNPSKTCGLSNRPHSAQVWLWCWLFPLLR